MNKIGSIISRKTKDIASSKIGIGFECLDRDMWIDSDSVYEAVADLGAKRARVQTGWGRTEIEAGVYDFAWLDRIVDKLLDAGCEPWFNLGYGNRLYTDAETVDACGWVPIYTEAARAAWQAYIAALVRHFKDRVTYYEIWNEPFGPSFWRPTPPNPKEYAFLVKLTAEPIRREFPDAKIIAGTYDINLWDAPTIRDFLAEGVGDKIDVFSFHRYRVFPEQQTLEWMDYFRRLIAKYGRSGLELWQGEAGFPSQYSETQALSKIPFTEESQAKLLARSILNDLANRVDFTSYFEMSDFTCYRKAGFSTKPNHFGVVTTDDPVRRKLSFYMMSRLCSLFDSETELDPELLVAPEAPQGCTKEEQRDFDGLAINSRTVAFQRKGYPLIAWWRKLNALNDNEPIHGNVMYWSPDKPMPDPVLIDPMDGGVYEIESIVEQPDFRVKGLDLPFKDYPMIMTARAAVADMIG